MQEITQEDNSLTKVPFTMQDLFMKYPIGTTITNKEIQGYRYTQTQSALLLADGSWKPL